MATIIPKNFVEFYSSGTWVIPPGVTRVRLFGCGGGGGGGGPSGGGGAGAIPMYAEVSVTPLDTISVVIGAGGTGHKITSIGGYTSILATAGGTSQFGNLIRFFGGSPGTDQSGGTSGAGYGNFTAGGAPGKAARGANGQSSNYVLGTGGTGGSGILDGFLFFGGGGGGGGSVGPGGNGCSANGYSIETPGTDGSLGGGGGGGGFGADFSVNPFTYPKQSGDGGAGFIKIWW